MGQKTNPNIIRLDINKKYFYRYLEKKSSELSLSDFNMLEIRKFTYKFFKNYNLQVHSCKINYCQNNILRVFISYFAIPHCVIKSNKKKKKKFFKKIKNFSTFHSNLKSISSIRNRKIKVGKGNFFKKKVRSFYFKQSRHHTKLLLKNTTAVAKSSYFLNYFCDSISKFLNKKIKISLILNQLNSNEKKKIDRRTVEFLKRAVSSLFFYKKFSFYKEGLNTLFLCAQRPDSVNLLANYLSINLLKQKNHINFLKFVMQTIIALKKNSKMSRIESIKIKLKGRINKRPRARHKFFSIGRTGVFPVLSLNSKIHYSQITSFTPNGTLGLKLWSLGKKQRFKKLKNQKCNLLINELHFFKGKLKKKELKEDWKHVCPLISKNYLPVIKENYNKQNLVSFSTITYSKVYFGDLAIVANQQGYINKIQLEATKLAIKRILKREGKLWQRVFPRLIVTCKSKGARMGKGKGKVKYSTCFIKRVGTILFEITGAKKAVALRALNVGKAKLPIKTSIV